MKKTILVSNIITGIAVGCLFVNFNQASKNDTLNYSAIVPFSPEETNNEENNIKYDYQDLTYASEKSVDAVAHITTEFIKEEITYDPFMRLFYGEEAYRIRERRGTASGSGVIISNNGYIVTNNHVVQDAHKINVVLSGNTYVAELIGTDPSTDIAVIKINKQTHKFLEFGNSDKLKLGEWVLAVGNPLNLQTTVTAGIVSAKNRNIDLLTKNFNPDKNVFPIESFIQTDAAVNSGNSGGALVNTTGELVGINTAIASGNGFYTGYSFAIPSNIVKKVTLDLIQYGEVKRVLLGVNLSENNSEISQANALKTESGILITQVFENSIAEKNKLKPNDIILKLENETIQSVAQFQGKMILFHPGETINIEIMRGDEIKSLQIEL